MYSPKPGESIDLSRQTLEAIQAFDSEWWYPRRVSLLALHGSAKKVYEPVCCRSSGIGWLSSTAVRSFAQQQWGMVIL